MTDVYVLSSIYSTLDHHCDIIGVYESREEAKKAGDYSVSEYGAAVLESWRDYDDGSAMCIFSYEEEYEVLWVWRREIGKFPVL